MSAVRPLAWPDDSEFLIANTSCQSDALQIRSYIPALMIKISKKIGARAIPVQSER